MDNSKEKEFITIVRSYEKIIYKVCSFYVSNEHPMADLYQEVICNLWKAFPGFRNESALSTWIYRVTLNTCITGLRKEKQMPEYTLPVSVLENTEDDAGDTARQERIKEMYSMINRLKTMEKAIVLLYLEEKSYQEIADITGLTRNNVAIKLKRSKEKLREMSIQQKSTLNN